MQLCLCWVGSPSQIILPIFHSLQMLPFAPSIHCKTSAVYDKANCTSSPVKTRVWSHLEYNPTLDVEEEEEEDEEEEEKLVLFMKRIINFQHMLGCKEDWRIINLLRAAGLQEDGPC